MKTYTLAPPGEAIFVCIPECMYSCMCVCVCVHLQRGLTRWCWNIFWQYGSWQRPATCGEKENCVVSPNHQPEYSGQNSAVGLHVSNHASPSFSRVHAHTHTLVTLGNVWSCGSVSFFTYDSGWLLRRSLGSFC